LAAFEEEEIEAAAAVLGSGRVNYWTGDEGERSSVISQKVAVFAK
jgi:hypothetical protein